MFDLGLTNIKLRRSDGGNETLGPCTCLEGEPRLSALGASFKSWCTCDPNAVMLAALEAAVRAGRGSWTEEAYCNGVYVAVRAILAAAAICQEAHLGPAFDGAMLSGHKRGRKAKIA